MKSLAEFSVKNSMLINIVSMVFVLAGVWSIFNVLNREAFPNINFDIVTVSTPYPGSTPQEVEKLITIPLEKELRQIDDVDELTSVSAEGMSMITLVLEEDAKDKPKIVNDIQRAVERVDDLPTDLPNKPLVSEMRTKDSPIIEVSLGGNLNQNELRQHVRNLEKRLLDLKDISRITRKGYSDEQIWVEVNPQTLRDQHVSLGEISRALAAQNQAIPGGKFYDQKNEFILRTSGQFGNPSDVEQTIVRASEMGAPLRLSDIAKVTSQYKEDSVLYRTRGTPAITLVLIKKESGDAIRLVEDAKIIISKYQSELAPNLDVSYVNDFSYYIKRRLNVLITNGMLGLLMVAVSLFLFLSPSSAISACLGIPTALLMTFSFMGVFDISINLISLFGLILVLGMLVDEDIVISENVYRHLEEGKSPEEASVQGAREVGPAVITTVLTTIAAFIPLFIMGGIMGKFTRDIPKVVTITLCCSLVEALIILPSHIKEITHAMVARKQLTKAKANKFLEWGLAKYESVLRRGLKHRYLYTGGLILVFVISLFTATKMQFILFPNKGVEIFFVRAEADVGDSLEVTAQKMKPLEDLIKQLPNDEVDTFTTMIGLTQNDPNDPFTYRASHVAQIQVYLTPEDDRERTSQDIIDWLRPRTDKLKTLKKISYDSIRNGPPVGKPVQIRILGDNYLELEKIAAKFKSAVSRLNDVILKKHPDADPKVLPITDIEDDYKEGKKEKRIAVDSTLASQSGLSVQSVAIAVREAFEGIPATNIKSTDEEIDILVKYPLSARHDPQSLQNLLIQNARGQLVPLKSVAKFIDADGVQSIKHFDGDRAINVTANLNESLTSPVEVAKLLKADLKKIQDEFPDSKIQMGGEYEDTEESLNELFFAFIISIAIILIVLVAMFKSISQTLLVMFTIPFSIIGVILAFMAHGEPISFMSLLGLIALTGIVVDGATIMIDFVNTFQSQGMPAMDAILKGCKMRLRGVVLTTITTVLGVLPSTYGIGGSDPFIEPMALALNYGIIFSTILTLFYIPLFLAILHDAGEFLKRFRRTAQ